MKKDVLIKISIFICIIIVLIIVFNIIKLSNKVKDPQDLNPQVDNTNIINESDKSNRVTAIEVSRARSCICKYINIANKTSPSYYGYDENGNYVRIASEETIKNNVYNLLSKKYIQDNNITIDNLYEFIDDINQDIVFDIIDMRYYSNPKSNQYVVYGIMQDLKGNFIKDAYYIVNINEEDNLFSIEPLLNNELDIEQIKTEDIQIEPTEENNIINISMTQENLCKEYIYFYKKLLLLKPEEAYKYLDEEYKKIKFGNIENFEKYINDNKEELKTIRLEKYDVYKQDEYTQYTLVDQYDNYYIIKETSLMEFTVMMDNYTIGLPEVVEKYNSASDLEKANINIMKFFTAINNKDYTYAYNRLDKTYRDNNFKTQADFEKYIKENFYTNNTVKYEKATKEGNLYVLDLVITNDDNSMEKTEKTVIIKILEGFDFVMSFNLE